MLAVREAGTGYDGLQVLWDVSIHVDEGEFVGLLGPNGAGKTTLLHTVIGLQRLWSGDVVLDDRSVKGVPAHKTVRRGVGLISETCNLFPHMSVRDNLLTGAWNVKDRDVLRSRLDRVEALFPRLRERVSQWAGTLSGGERKMLAIGRALMSDPRLLLVDEPSLGLAPNTTNDVFDVLVKLHEEGHSILLVEQNVRRTLQIVDRAYVLEQGQIRLDARSSEMMDHDHIQRIYMGEE